MAATSDFAGAGQKPGMEIWRIENLQPVLVDPAQHGKFYTGDSYIILKTEQKHSLSYALHFWLGAETSIDEAGVAAYKTVELDDYLKGKPVQHREVQNHESPLFLSYFKEGIEYLSGGVASGFRHVDRDSYEPRLLWIKGRRNVRIQTVPTACSSLNDGDVFVLDLGQKLFFWAGADSNRYEKAKGLDVMRKIRDRERGGQAELVNLDGTVDEAEFWAALGGKGPIRSADEGGSDEVAEKTSDIKLFQVSNPEAEYELHEILERPLKKALVSSNNLYLLDTPSAVFVWIGKNASAEAKRSGMKVGQNYLERAQKPNYTAVTRVVENAETVVFKSFWQEWDPVSYPVDHSRVIRSQSKVAAARDQPEIDVNQLHQQTVAQQALVDDGSGKLQIWRVENFELKEVDPSLYGQFYAGDSYVLLYTYQKNRRDEYIIYFWQGRDSSSDEKGSSALLAKDLDDKMGGKPVQVRVVQNKEPNHFLSLFKGQFIVRAGGVPSAFRNADAGAASDNQTALFHIKGTNPLNTRAIQVDTSATALNSGDCFVLCTPACVYCWAGSGASDDEKVVAGNVAARLAASLPVVSLAEGEESDEFWSALGGQAPYSQMCGAVSEARDPRLFHLSNATGVVKVEEIVDFAQDDLIDEDVMILDTFLEVFIWVGSQSNETEKQTAMEVAKKYVASATDGRSPDSPIVVVQAGSEPAMFTCHFRGWDTSKAQGFEDPYLKRLQTLNANKKSQAEHRPSTQLKATGKALVSDTAPADAPSPSSGSFADPAATKFPVDLLRTNPAGVDPSKKELYLSDADFLTIFGMDRAAFEKEPKWKQVQKKKDVGLF
eukprot:GILJ01001608.1.p1 GENE.GILJ01001608.1~~GILJ01001608.1.p1  ORF type:complete len:830 (-),score=172.89 GILJ01001608.1:131-2620(-)